jgi:uncharacterized protein
MQEEKTMAIIDFHVHAGNFHRLRDDIQALLTKRPMEPGTDVGEIFSQPAQLDAYLKRNGVVRAVVIAECGPGTNFSIDSRMIADFTRDKDDLVPFGSINPNYHTPLAEWENSVTLGVRGFKFYPADHSFNPFMPAMLEVYQRCAEYGLPVIFHTGLTAQRDASQEFIRPNDFLPLIERFPDLVVILAHAGKSYWHQEAFELVLRHPNAYVDTALVDPNVIRDVCSTRPEVADKILFGSDWPVSGSYSTLLARYAGLGIPEDMLHRIQFDNGERLLNTIFAVQAKRHIGVRSAAAD